QQRLTSDAARPLGGFEVAAELVFEHAVDALDLLLFPELQAVAGELRLPGFAVLARGKIALLDGAFLRVAPLSLEEQLHRLAAAEPADRTNVTSHLATFHHLKINPIIFIVIPSSAIHSCACQRNQTRRRFGG